MKHRASAGLAALAIAGVLGLSACGGGVSSGSGNEQEAAQQQKDTTAIEFAEPLPEFGSSTLRQELIDIEATEALGIRSTTFATSQNGTLMWSCPSIGLPVPVTDQLSNPDQVVSGYGGGSNNGYALATIGQMDPDGVYKGESTGTDVICLYANGQPYTHYAEEYADAVTASAHWVANPPDGQHIVVTGAPDMPDCSVFIKHVAKKNVRYERCTDPDAKADVLSPRDSTTPAP